MQSWVWVDVLQGLIPSLIDRSVCPRRFGLAFKIMVWLCERLHPKRFCLKILEKQILQQEKYGDRPTGVMLINRPFTSDEEWLRYMEEYQRREKWWHQKGNTGPLPEKLQPQDEGRSASESEQWPASTANLPADKGLVAS